MTDKTWMFERGSSFAPHGSYLDSASTSQMLCASYDAMASVETQIRCNVGRSSNRLSDRCNELYERARTTTAQFLGATFEQTVFTAGATGALNMLANSLRERLSSGDEIVISQLEHHSNFVPWQQLACRTGATLKCWPVTEQAVLDMSVIDQMVTPRTKIIALTHVSNVTGFETDLGMIAGAARTVGALLVVDAAQAIPHNLVSIDADFLVFSGHKAYGPTGVGVVASPSGQFDRLKPTSFGGGMIGRVGANKTTWAELPARFEAGTPPFVQAIGLGAAIDWLRHQRQQNKPDTATALSRMAVDGLKKIQRVVVVGHSSQARFGIVSFAINGVHAHDVCQVLDSHNVWVRAGHLCAQPLLKALGLPAVVRASFGPYNTVDDVMALLEGVEDSLSLVLD